MAIKGILFDFNGTLFFDSDFHMEAFRRTLRAYGKPIPSDDYMIQNIFGRTNETIYVENIDPHGTPEDIKSFANQKESQYRSFCLENPKDFHFTEGACELLNYLKENKIPYCMATGAEIDNLEFYFEHMGLTRWFTLDNIVYTDGSFQGKPEPDIYCLAAARLGLSPEECLVFEDGTSGIISANRAGAGAVVAVCEEKLPSPINDQTRIDAIYHDFLSWKEILTKFDL